MMAVMENAAIPASVSNSNHMSSNNLLKWGHKITCAKAGEALAVSAIEMAAIAVTAVAIRQ